MKKETKEILNTALKGFIARLEKTETFVLNQAPDICQQMVREVVVQCQIQLYAAALTVVLSLIGIVVGAHNIPEHGDSGWYAPIVFGVLGLIVAICMTFDASYKLLFMKNCPKLFLLREFKRLLK